MDIKKLLTGGIAAGIAFFLLGWLIYGVLLMDFMANNPGVAKGVNRAQENIQFLYLIAGNLAFGFLLAFVFVKANISGIASGLVTGAVIGLLVSVGHDCIMYATTNVASRKEILADVIATTAMWAITGAIVGWLMGMGKKEA
jgi:hypothetical protein